MDLHDEQEIEREIKIRDLLQVGLRHGKIIDTPVIDAALEKCMATAFVPGRHQTQSKAVIDDSFLRLPQRIVRPPTSKVGLPVERVHGKQAAIQPDNSGRAELTFWLSPTHTIERHRG